MLGIQLDMLTEYATHSAWIILHLQWKSWDKTLQALASVSGIDHALGVVL